MKCEKCRKNIDIFEAFPNNLCVDCYSEVYEKMSDEEKKPDFTSKKLLNI